MTDTPRTDAVSFYGAMTPTEEEEVVPAHVARQLERELNEARKDAERLKYLMSRHKLALYRMVTMESYQGVLAGTDEYCTRMRLAIDAALAAKEKS